MTQLSLFTKPVSSEAAPAPNVESIRKLLMRELRRVTYADHVPWPRRELERWAVDFPELAKALPPDEAAELTEAFAKELARVRKYLDDM